ncbi:tRNA pseudouridine(65) synthase TruC [Leucothrix sargassi]|nr:tRNA pseudouridine(65) synthase TruC [Leucothrix sargassi]
MLDILYQDESMVAINKPSGLLVHRSPIDKHETRFAIQLTRDQIGQHVFPVHRLDKPTSGVLLFALSSEVAALLTKQFTEKTISKRYWAVVRGYIKDNGVIDYALQEQLDKMTDRLVSPDKAPQDAVTEFECLAKSELPYPVGRYQTARYSLVELSPKTGRKHQLRRHMKHIFHPIIGDTSHGDGKQNTFLRETFALSRLMLHAKSLELTHPVSGEPLHIQADLPESFSEILTKLKLDVVEPA